MKKILLTLGAVASVAAPVAAVVACDSGTTGGSESKLPILENGRHASKVYTYTFTDDMSKGQYETWQAEYSQKIDEWLEGPGPEDKTKTHDQSKAAENAWYKSHNAPLFKFSCEGKTVEIDWSLGEKNSPAEGLSVAKKAMETSLQALGNKLHVVNTKFDF